MISSTPRSPDGSTVFPPLHPSLPPHNIPSRFFVLFFQFIQLSLRHVRATFIKQARNFRSIIPRLCGVHACIVSCSSVHFYSLNASGALQSLCWGCLTCFLLCVCYFRQAFELRTDMSVAKPYSGRSVSFQSYKV